MKSNNVICSLVATTANWHGCGRISVTRMPF